MIKKYHTADRHAYVIASEVLQADVLINMPKPKTHRFGGVTIAMKNLVGIAANKETVPHYSVGSSAKKSGDEYEKFNVLKRLYTMVEDEFYQAWRYDKTWKRRIYGRLFRSLRKPVKRMYPNEFPFHASGERNDTLWRSIFDLNKIIVFADKEGKMQDAPQRKILTVADMIISGEGQGPLAPSPKPVSIIAMAENNAVFDEVITAYMGFNSEKIPQIKNIRHIQKYNFCPPLRPVIKSNLTQLEGKTVEMLTSDDVLHFLPHSSWADCGNNK
jgi:hypothetical protein